MLDKYVNAVMNKVSGIVAGVEARRHELERQRGSDRYAQSYLGTALKHPEGHTSPLRKSAERAQQEYASIRAEWAEVSPQMLTLAASLMIARERRDETKAVWERHDAEEQRRVATKYHLEVRRLFAQLYDHGVRPAMLDLVRPETIGVLADLILWDASDRERTDPNSPLQEVLSLYAGRTMMMPVDGQTVTRSMPGKAPASAKNGDPIHYRFDPEVGGEPSATNDDVPDQGGTVPEPVTVVDAAPLTTPQAFVAPLSPADEAQKDEAVPVVLIDSARATEWAKHIANTDPQFMAVYWPRGHAIGNYDQRSLIAALEDEIASGRGWSATPTFLAAAQEGRAVEFIAERRGWKTSWLAKEIEAGKEAALQYVRDAGLLR